MTNKEKAIAIIKSELETGGIRNALVQFESFKDWAWSNFFNNAEDIKEQIVAMVSSSDIQVYEDGTIFEEDGSEVDYRNYIGDIKKLWDDEQVVAQRAKSKRIEDRFQSFEQEVDAFKKKLSLMRDQTRVYDKINSNGTRREDVFNSAIDALDNLYF